MLINGKERGFFYSVGAHLAMGDLEMEKAKANGRIRAVVHSAVIMNKAFEDRKAMDDPDYKPDYLTLEEVNLLPMYRLKELSETTETAIREGMQIEVEAESKKNNEAAGNE